MMRIWEPIDTHTAVMYLGASCCLTMTRLYVRAIVRDLGTGKRDALTRSSNASRTVHSSDGSRRENSLPLPRDVVRLVRRYSRPVRDVGSGGEVSPNISNGNLIRKAQHAEAHYQADAVEDDDRSS